MKVLFAVSNEEVSESIVKRYQREYKEIISYKNVYYFNAILKELQKDKSYDRIVISEELEAFTNAQYSQIDKFIFDKLDNISDEASNLKGDDIPIILICSDRREKSEEMLVKLFGIGIYNALLGNDRSVDNVCKLLNKPRLKKEAKIYYKIDSDDVSYQVENENDVSEMEIQNILAHYKRLGRDERRYVESFNNIAAQYNDVQLRIISKFLPLNVRAVLEEKSPKYQQIISFNSKISDNLRKQSQNVEKAASGTSEKLLNNGNKDKTLTKPVVIPSSVNMEGNKKLAKPRPEPEMKVEEKVNVEKTIKPIALLDDNDDDDDDFGIDKLIEKTENMIERNTKIASLEEIEEDNVEKTTVSEQIEEQQPKRGRGRPRKNPVVTTTDEIEKPKRGRGRPKKIVEEVKPVEETDTEDDDFVLPGFADIDLSEKTPKRDFKENVTEEEEEETILPGFFSDDEEETEKEEVPQTINERTFNNSQINEQTEQIAKQSELMQTNEIKPIQDVDITNLLTSDKKVATFVGTSKNGTSFIVNNLAQITSEMGIDTAILDTTQNRNSYYIYTQNDEDLRKTAMNCINGLLNGVANGINAGKNLTIYTALPNETEGIENAGQVLQTLLKKHTLVLIDCDFETPSEYFKKSQEIYLVQSYDILTIQPLTAFLRELKAKNILEENKLRIILNKALKLRGVNDKTIIGGIAYYNDPAMSFMTELFDKNRIRYIIMPFSEETYQSYLENIINCEVSVRKYPKNIIQTLNELANMVYPVVSGKSTYVPPQMPKNGFTPNMNATLNQMRNKY